MAWACRRVSDAGKGNIHLQIYPHDGARITSLKALVLKYYANGSRSAELFSMAVPNGAVGRATGECDAECWWACYSLPANKPPHALHGMACYSRGKSSTKQQIP